MVGGAEADAGGGGGEHVGAATGGGAGGTEGGGEGGAGGGVVVKVVVGGGGAGGAQAGLGVAIYDEEEDHYILSNSCALALTFCRLISNFYYLRIRPTKALYFADAPVGLVVLVKTDRYT